MSDTVEQPKPVEVDATPAVVEPTKPEETPAVVAETPAPVIEETPQVTPATVTEDSKEAAKPAEVEAEKSPKGRGFIAKLIAPFNKRKGRSPEKGTEAVVETPVVEEAPKPEEPAATGAVTETPKEAVEPVKEAVSPAVETPADETPAVETPTVETVVGDLKKEKYKFSRRLSARVTDMFKKTKLEAPSTAKVNEHPPKIDEPTPVAPLENPASDSSALAETSVEPSEPAKPAEPAPAASPIVAAAA